MPKKVEADYDGLELAASVLDELRRDFEEIAASTKDVMGHMTVACGNDHYGHQFTDGEKGFKNNCESSAHASEAVSESFRRYTEGVGGKKGAKTLFSGTDHTSGENIRRTV
ncbi:hypothetical protein [Nocardia pneumoniae]|uniref:hypothetical protein n=1 Tax=Nocardia pneumoniae TaxID=228601 RepID=UPI0003200158|nr:hypothetical protein [Nocardia pneumoniae]